MLQQVYHHLHQTVSSANVGSSNVVMHFLTFFTVCHFCSGENDKANQLSCFAAQERMERLADRLINKFVREGKKLSKLFMPEKGIKDHRDTKDVDLLKFVAAISGFHSVELHKKLGKKDSKEAIEHNKKALFKFIARIYAMIMDAPIHGDGKRFWVSFLYFLRKNFLFSSNVQNLSCRQIFYF